MLLRAVAAWSLVALAGVALAGQTLPLGPGTACTLASQSEARKTLGTRGRHVLACASPSGILTRVYITRAGRVGCTERLQVAADGGMTPIGAPCRGRASAGPATRSQDIDEPVNLSGDWNVDVGFATCTVTVVQDGSDLTLSGSCGSFGTLAGSGTISFAGRTFTVAAPASGGIAEQYCAGETVRLQGTVSPDGQAVDGSVGCGGYDLSFHSRRSE
jgi:hypothetical protein